MDTAYRIWIFLNEQVLAYLSALVMLGATVLAVVEIFRRYLLGTTYHWGQDAVTYFMVSAIFLFFVVTQLRRSHLAVTALPEWLQSRKYEGVLRALRLVNTLLSLGFCSALTYWGLPSVARNLELGRLTQSMVMPLWPFQCVLLLGFGLMIIALLFQLYQDVNALRGRPVFTWAGPTDESLEI